jgi:hypothetical protein
VVSKIVSTGFSVSIVRTVEAELSERRAIIPKGSGNPKQKCRRSTRPGFLLVQRTRVAVFTAGKRARTSSPSARRKRFGFRRGRGG